jgi:hypothetical protein
MNLLEVRQKFIKLSGRADLATTSTGSTELHDVDNGADFFINAAVRLLDREQENTTTESWFEKNISAGEFLVELTSCRNISQIWFVNSEGIETKLEWKSFEELRVDYPELGSTDVGVPYNWARYPNVRNPLQLFEGARLDTTSILIMPPTDAAITVKIYGKFYSAKLVNNMDENFWSMNHEDILVMATLREIEGFYRNTEGYNDFDRITGKKLRGIDVDLASIDAADAMEMEG